MRLRYKKKLRPKIECPLRLMSGIQMLFLTSFIDDYYNYERADDMKCLYDLLFDENGYRVEKVYKNIKFWIEDIMEMAEIPDGCFRTMYVDSVDLDVLIEYIRDTCNPERQQECRDE